MSNPAIPAATLIVVRERADAAPEILMVERAAGMAFAGGALVFPGGRIDLADEALGERLAMPGAAVAAVRETIEETGVPAALSPVPGEAKAHAIQQALIDGRDFGELLAEAGLSIAADALTPFARWVPKFHAVRRFDTLFFVAPAPPGEWAPRAFADECTGAFWLSASEALERDRTGTAQLIFPTRRNLERLAQHTGFAELLADARAHRVEPITPWLEEDNGERFVTIPADLGYPVTRERLDGLWRGGGRFRRPPQAESRAGQEKGDPPAADPLRAQALCARLFQMVREVLVHLEHADPVLAAEDSLQLVVSHDFPFVLRVL